MGTGALAYSRDNGRRLPLGKRALVLTTMQYMTLGKIGGTAAVTTRETRAIRMEGRMGLNVTSSSDKTIWGRRWTGEQWVQVASRTMVGGEQGVTVSRRTEAGRHVSFL